MVGFFVYPALFIFKYTQRTTSALPLRNTMKKRDIPTEEALPTPELIAETEPVPVAEPETPPPPTEIPFEEADVSMRYDDVYQWRRPDRVADVRWRNDAYELRCLNGVTLRLQVVGPDTLRLRYSPDGQFLPDHSYALDPARPPQTPTATLTENEHEYVLNTGTLQAVVSKEGLRLRFFDADDRLLCEDAEGYAAKRTVLKGWNHLHTQLRSRPNEVYYGLGDKPCEANLLGRRFENWCTDAFGFSPDTDPLYRAIPVFFGLHQGLHYGIFLDNAFRSFFDFNSAADQTVHIGAEGGELNYYFFSAPTATGVAQAYARLTGTHALPPLWALGYHQCRWSYYPEGRVREIADTFRSLQIPCDAIYLDIDYMDGFRCFTWNADHFPDPAGLISELRAQGFRTVLMLDPGIKEDHTYSVYQQGIEGDHFLKNAEGQIAHAPVWPGFCAFPDFSRPDTRAWWATLHPPLLDAGVDGFWNDMNEPAVFHIHHKTLPDTVMHAGDGHPGSHLQYHNTYGLLMTRATTEGLQQMRPDKRPFLLTRASFSGGQRFAAVWTGDNWSTWEHLQIANVQCQRLSVSGFSFCGTDIGGFAGEPDPELFVRWLQLAVFHPLMRVHSMGQHISGDALTDEAQLTDPALHRVDQEPWSFGDKWTELSKKAIELRYALLPCIYTAFWLLKQHGTPVLRHGFMEDSTNPKLLKQDRDFLFGEHLFVSPVIQPKTQRQEVHLPKGLWYYFWNGQTSRDSLFINLMPDQIPFFVRAGAVLPIYPVRQWTDEKPVEELTLYAFYKDGTEKSHLYEDDGEGYAHENGQYRLTVFDTSGTKGQFSLTKTTEGQWPPTYERVLIYLVGFPEFVKRCLVDGEDIPIREIRLRDRSLYTVQTHPAFEVVEWVGS